MPFLLPWKVDVWCTLSVRTRRCQCASWPQGTFCPVSVCRIESITRNVKAICLQFLNLPRDQFEISPAASPEILHHAVCRTWLFKAHSEWLYYQFSLPHLYISPKKGCENVLFELGSSQGRHNLARINGLCVSWLLKCIRIIDMDFNLGVSGYQKWVD